MATELPEPDASVARCTGCGSWTWRGSCSTCGSSAELEAYPVVACGHRKASEHDAQLVGEFAAALAAGVGSPEWRDYIRRSV